MTSHYVRVAGSIYGPFSQDQLAQMRAAGRINDQSEISADRVSWRSLGAGATGSPPAAPAVVNADPGFAGGGGLPATKQYLDRLRNQTRYPFYRTTLLVASILGYVAAAVPVVALVLQVIWFGLSSIHVLMPFAVLAGSALAAVVVTVAREVASMYADLVDSTLAHHAKEQR